MRWLGWANGYSGSFLASCAVHGVLLFGTAGAVIQSAKYEVEAGSGGMEVSLIAAPPLPAASAPAGAVTVPEAPKEEEAPIEPPKPDDWTLESVPLPEPQTAPAAEAPPQPEQPSDAKVAETPSSAVGDGSSPVPGNDPTTLYFSGGAVSGKHGRFSNPAPPYPYAAIRAQQEGVVTLQAVIDNTGRPLSVEIIAGSGFPLLDESALRTVRRWKFDPAHIGFLPVQSTIVIPIRFVLEDRFRKPS